MSLELSPLKIGSIEIDPPVILAPLAGYTDYAFRTICRRLGAPYVATEMMLDKSVLVSGKLQRQLLKTDEQEHPIAAQLIGGNPETMSQAARLVCERGFDVVDLNFACPVRKAIRRGRGGHLMRDPELAIRITRAVIEAADRPVTLKIRRSFDEDDREGKTAIRIAENAFDLGAAAVCIHGRSVEAVYRGPSDWKFTADFRKRFENHTVIGSGDARHPKDVLEMFRRTGVDAVAAARGALGNPWFFSQVKDLLAGRKMRRPSLSEQREVLLRHYRMATELYGEKRASRIMRSHGIRYSRMHPQPKRLRMAFVDVSKSSDWLEVLDEFYDEDRWSLPVGPHTAGGLG